MSIIKLAIFLALSLMQGCESLTISAATNAAVERCPRTQHIELRSGSIGKDSILSIRCFAEKSL